MDDTAQPMAAETPLHEQFASAADLMKKARAGTQTRDESGKFAREETEIPVEPDDTAEAEDHLEEEALEEADAEEYDEEYDEDEAPDEDQAEAVEMPKSWSKEDEETWHSLSPSAQAKIAEREGQRDTALNSKFQEVANQRKEYEAKLAEANTSRDKWAQDYDLLVADLSLPKPTPQQYGYGTQNFDRAGYDAAVIEWEQGSEQLTSLKQQREEIRAQQEAEAMQSWQAVKQEIEAEYAPKLLSIMPELTDPVKAEPALRELVSWGIAQGLPADTFSEENQHFITSAQLRLLALAKKAMDAEGTSKKAPPKKQPAIKPGVATPRSAQKTVARKKAMSRLETSGSIEDAVRAMQAARR